MQSSSPISLNLTQHYLYILIISGGLFLLLKVINHFSKKTKYPTGTIVLLFIAFSFLGLTVGFPTGLSRDPSVNAIMPAILAFIGGIAVYHFSRSNVEESVRLHVLLTVIFFSFSVMYSIEIGSLARVKHEDFERDLEHWYTKDLERYKVELELSKNGIQFTPPVHEKPEK